jgi:mxaJ protein
MGIPYKYDQVATTLPYLRSTYLIVIVDQGSTAGVRTEKQFLTLPTATLYSLRIGVFDRSPATAWLVKNQLINQVIPYATLNADPERFPGEIIERDLAAGKLDAAIVWGPIAGYFVSRVTQKPLIVVPLASTTDMPLDYSIAMGVRGEDTTCKLQVQKLINENHLEILNILKSYNVPLVDV